MNVKVLYYSYREADDGGGFDWAFASTSSVCVRF